MRRGSSGDSSSSSGDSGSGLETLSTSIGCVGVSLAVWVVMRPSARSLRQASSRSPSCCDHAVWCTFDVVLEGCISLDVCRLDEV
jgi:hypothetical protein